MSAKISFKTISQLTASEIVSDLRNSRYSLLKSLGCARLRREISLTGFFCLTVLRLSELFAGSQRSLNRRQYLQRDLREILRLLAPIRIDGHFPDLGACLAIGYNHPTIGDFLRVLNVWLTQYPERDILLPVDICWYEHIAPASKRLEMMGLYIVPIITPATRRRMNSLISVTDLAAVHSLSRKMNDYYLAYCSKFAQSKGKGLIVLAQSATRRDTVFASVEAYLGSRPIRPQTLTYMGLHFIRNQLECYFLPVTVLPPKSATRRLNLCRRYSILPGHLISDGMMSFLCNEHEDACNARKFERYFLNNIATKLEDAGRMNLVYPTD